MASEVQSLRAAGASNHMTFSLCLITACLLNITTLPPDPEQGSYIILWFNLAVGYLLAMASVFSANAKTKAVVAKMSGISALLSMVLVMMGELSRTPMLSRCLMFRHVTGFSDSSCRRNPSAKWPTHVCTKYKTSLCLHYIFTLCCIAIWFSMYKVVKFVG
ncbi:hypothetical protein PVAP13_7NG268100 [Panicum virgatum]|uniref:Uncharacterized protein n=1 Tax=Panicum virgatum TaxID=38727 RepID=A0A8T0PSK2_PANVG|nr:hypothetical protein PVAP13_7NG268100 [Panicum virgatum]KAG2565368.1 hypothetical protein PVAP13_7NG268100 [Panicum virgatum]KAG2565369.1 hypothetical protein PVAP13_7NG268100 [Panicum virgatum]